MPQKEKPTSKDRINQLLNSEAATIATGLLGALSLVTRDPSVYLVGLLVAGGSLYNLNRISKNKNKPS